MLNEWFNESLYSCYWLVDSQTFEMALEANNYQNFKDTFILFDNTPFEDVMDFTPKLIPVSEEVKNLPKEILNHGIGLKTEAPKTQLLEHLQSLLLAALDGEEVLFRFYDINVISPILREMEQGELEQFLGNIKSLAVFAENGLETYSNNNESQYRYQNRPWWIIKPRHLEHLYNVENHARLLERFWWEKIPVVMAELDDSLNVITQFLKQGVERYPSKEKAELFTLKQMTHLTNIPLNEVTGNLLLDEDEIDFMNEIKGQTN
ncbi:DUF4123 domain-containing protein [Vibrio salinus]|uniref:DUF4123 domain-containing protein n=1 Tax=Vibrio salinus TaxID=2899784 RepID=UPI001E3074F0|nr:DUF4123 domain-containing protein [Vibrio salinus]MCE0492489.1 DUF4123 domain-containing protein [Vibrio salinus]